MRDKREKDKKKKKKQQENSQCIDTHCGLMGLIPCFVTMVK